MDATPALHSTMGGLAVRAVRRVRVVVVGLAALAMIGTMVGSAAAAAPAGRASKPAGAPITIGIIYNEDESLGQSNKQVEMALNAAIKAQAANGGVNGSPVKVVVCKNKANDPNGGAACATKMAENPKVVAVVGSANSEGDAINPILEKAGVAAIGSLPISTGDFTSPIAFPVMSGALGTPGAATLLYDKENISKISLGNLELAAAAQVPILINQALGTRGAKLSGEVKLPLDKQDLSAEAAQLANDGDGIVVTSLPEQFGRLLRAGQSTGTWTDKKVATLPSILTPAVLKSLGSDANGVFLATGGLATTDIKRPGVLRYLKDLKKYGDPSKSQDDLVKNAWLAFQVFAAAAKGQTTVDRASVLAAMNQLQYDPQGMAPKLDFTKQNTTVFGGAVPRAFNTSVMYAQVKNGKIVAIKRQFVDPFTAP
jgi:ABC-type branched-subunit amino acid transport system substrate-binding protein